MGNLILYYILLYMQSSSNSGTIKMAFNTKQIEITDDLNDSKKLNFDCSLIPPSTTVSLIAPIQNGTILTTSSSVVASKLKTNTTEVEISTVTAPTSGQVLTAINDVSAEWQTPASNPFFDNVALLKNSTDATKKLIIKVENIPNATTQTVNYPATNNSDTFATENASQTFNFKTILNSTINDETNDIASNKLKTQTGPAGSAVSIINDPIAGQVLTSTSAITSIWKTPQDLAILESAAISLPATITTAFNSELGNLFTNVVYNNGNLYNPTNKYFSFTNTGLYLITFKATITTASAMPSFTVFDAFGNFSMGTLIDMYVPTTQKNTICASGVYLYPTASQLDAVLSTNGVSTTFDKLDGLSCMFSVVRLG